VDNQPLGSDPPPPPPGVPDVVKLNVELVRAWLAIVRDVMRQ
jgi:hypothetical protein